MSRSTTQGFEVRFFVDGLCQVLEAGRIRSEFPTVYSVYNQQYPTPISADGKRVHVQSWECGLFCYELETGTKLWHQGPGKVRNVLCTPSFVLTEMVDRGVWLRRPETGELVRSVAMPSITCLMQVDDHLVLAGPHQGRYILYSLPHFDEVQALRRQEIDPYRCAEHSVDRAWVDGNELVVEGREAYPGRDLTRALERPFRRTFPLVAPYGIDETAGNPPPNRAHHDPDSAEEPA